MKKAAIVMDEWKLSIFNQHLTNAGYKYVKFPGPVKGTLTLNVETNNVDHLTEVIEEAVQACEKSRLH